MDNSSVVSGVLIAALAVGAVLGLALICFSVCNRKKLPKGMTAAFTAVGVLACLSAALMAAGLLR